MPLIETNALLINEKHPVRFLVQINRWVKAGKLVQIKRGAYLVTPEYRITPVFEPFLASALVRPSYISLEKALEFHGLIPDAIGTFTSVTTRRPVIYGVENLRFEYRHARSSLFWGYQAVVRNGQTGFIALPEKALLDLFYLTRRKISPDYLYELRLQNLDKINWTGLHEFACRFRNPRINKASIMLQNYYFESQAGNMNL